jgi:hypothetical protein
LADYLTSHPEVPTPYIGVLNAYVTSKKKMAAIARLGEWKKGYNDSYMWLSKQFGDNVSLDINIDRTTVCHGVVVGKKMIPATPEQEVDVIKWVCDESLLEEHVCHYCSQPYEDEQYTPYCSTQCSIAAEEE